MKAKIIIFLIIASLLSSGALEAQESSLKLKVVTEQANIRLRPDIGSVIISQVPKGTILESWEKLAEWYKVKVKEEEPELVFGYVHESLVMVISPLPAEKDTEETIQEIEGKEQEEPTQPRFVPPSLPPSEPEKPLFALTLLGGGNIVSGGDINAGAQGLAAFYSDALGTAGTGDVDPVRLGAIYGAELGFPLLPYLFLGLGGDYFQSQETSRVEYQATETMNTFITKPQIQALPLRFFISLYPSPSFYLKIGLEYYFAEANYFYRFETETSWEEWRGEAKAQDIGFLGGIGLEWKLFTPISLVIEAMSRYARVSGFEGENTYTHSDGSIVTEKGKLYFYQGKVPGDKTYPLLFIRETEPSETDVADLKEASVNFSGFSLKLGIKIRF